MHTLKHQVFTLSRNVQIIKDMSTVRPVLVRINWSYYMVIIILKINNKRVNNCV